MYSQVWKPCALWQKLILYALTQNNMFSPPNIDNFMYDYLGIVEMHKTLKCGCYKHVLELHLNFKFILHFKLWRWHSCILKLKFLTI